MGYLLGSLLQVIPVARGIGAIDLGVTAGLVLYGADPTPAAAGEVIWHAMALLVPIVTGSIVNSGPSAGATRMGECRGPVAEWWPPHDDMRMGPHRDALCLERRRVARLPGMRKGRQRSRLCSGLLLER
jgi:hypothetical protein